MKVIPGILGLFGWAANEKGEIMPEKSREYILQNLEFNFFCELRTCTSSYVLYGTERCTIYNILY
jgi:hypothetical protein